MKRRDLFLQMLTVVPIVAVPTALARLMLPKTALTNVINHVCEIEIHFLEGKTLSDFHTHRTKFMDVSSFERTVQIFEADGSLIRTERKVTEKSLRVSYVFRDLQSHNRFVETVDRGESVSVGQLSDTGFHFSRRHSMTLV